METVDNIRQILKLHGLKATPQRIIIYKALRDFNGHPTTDEIIENIRHSYPSISHGTVYKTLETFVQKDLIKRVKTDLDIMRYDSINKRHHHLYCIESEKIEDYFDDELNELLDNHFRKKKIPNFRIDNIKVHIIGRFSERKK